MKRLLVLLFALSSCSHVIHPALEFRSQRPIAAAHRAEHSRNSENSVEAIRAAQENKIQLIEIDIRESSDGKLFLFHNKKVDPETVRGPTELVGRPFSSLSSFEIERVVLPNGEAIPSFEDALKVLRSQSSFILDVKGDLEVRKRIIDVIRSQRANKSYWMLCYDPGCAAEVKDAGINGMEVLARLNDELSLGQAAPLNPKIVQIDCVESCSREVKEVKSKLPSVLVLATSLQPGLDNEDNWRRVNNEGVDIILTDRPLELISFFSNLEKQSQ